MVSYVVLAFDPGITTGVAIVDRRQKVLAALDMAVGDIVTRRFVNDLMLNVSGDKAFKDAINVAIELTPTPTVGKMNLQLRRVVESLRSIYPGAEMILPSTWKNSKAYRADDLDRYDTQHQRDAIMIARFYVVKLFGRSDEQPESPEPLIVP